MLFDVVMLTFASLKQARITVREESIAGLAESPQDRMRKTPLVKGDAMLKSLIILGNDRAEELAAKIATALLLGFLAFGLGHMLSVHYATNGHCDLSSHQDGTFGELRTTAQC